MIRPDRKLLNELGGEGHRGPALPPCDVPARPLAASEPQAGKVWRRPSISVWASLRQGIWMMSLDNYVRSPTSRSMTPVHVISRARS